MKKVQSKKGKSKADKSKQKKEEKFNSSSEEIEKPFDFGGLPDRNLKKNLGCG